MDDREWSTLSFFFRPLGDPLQIPLADWWDCPLLMLSS